jgi:hypothetical protein
MLCPSIELGTRTIHGSTTRTSYVRRAHCPDILKARELMLSTG